MPEFNVNGVVIVATKRQDDWYACLKLSTATWGNGRTMDEAIGSCFVTAASHDPVLANPAQWPTPTKERAEEWLKDQADGHSFKRLKSLGFYREPGHNCPQCGSEQTNQMTDRAWDCSACGNEWLEEPMGPTADRVKLSKSQIHHLRVAKARQAHPHPHYGEWVDPKDTYLEQKAAGKFLRHACFRTLAAQGLVEKKLMSVDGLRTFKCMVYRITSEGINALRSNGIN